MLIEFVGKFYDNHSLSIVNRNLVLEMSKAGAEVRIVALDSYSPEFKLDKEVVKQLKSLEVLDDKHVDVQVRHSYPPIWEWPTSGGTKVVYIQPWEYPKAPFEWQYKFETFADALVVPSNFCKNVFSKGGINPANIFVVPNGYTPSIFNALNRPKNSKFDFVYVGNPQWRKGLDILLNVWANCFTKSDNARLIIKDSPKVYGSSNLLNEIIKMQYKSGCAPVMYIDDDLSDTEMAELYRNSKVIVHPYRAEGFGMHIQEAAACGCFPIVSANGPTDDFIPNDCGIKIITKPTPVNIQDPSIFAMKPGDASTLMSTHTFINEPSSDHLEKALKYVYHSHEREKILNKVNDIKSLTTWKEAGEQLLGVLKNVNTRIQPRRHN